MNPSLSIPYKNSIQNSFQKLVHHDDNCIKEEFEDQLPSTINECNDKDEVLTVEAPSRKMPIVNHVISNIT